MQNLVESFYSKQEHTPKTRPYALLGGLKKPSRYGL
jgi:hypothetical protein